MSLVSRSWSRCCCFFAAFVCCWLASCCKSDEEAGAFHDQRKNTQDIVARALFCLNNGYIYSGCQGSFRLGPQGTLNVPPVAAGAFCGGPCLAETDRVLRCVDGVMDNFRFYNGATVGDVRFALGRGCGHTALRGDFDVPQRLGGDGYSGDGGGGSRRFISSWSLMLLLLPPTVVAMLLWS